MSQFFDCQRPDGAIQVGGRQRYLDYKIQVMSICPMLQFKVVMTWRCRALVHFLHRTGPKGARDRAGQGGKDKDRDTGREGDRVRSRQGDRGGDRDKVGNLVRNRGKGKNKTGTGTRVMSQPQQAPRACGFA